MHFHSLSRERESFSLKENFFLISDESEITDVAVSGDFVWFILKTEQLVSVIGSVDLDSSDGPSLSLAQPIVGLPWQALALSKDGSRNKTKPRILKSAVFSKVSNSRAVLIQKPF